MRNLEKEAIFLTALVRQSEDWSSEYAKDPATHAKLLRNEAALLVELLKYFRGIAKNIAQYIRWQLYLNQRPQTPNPTKPNFNVEVIVKDVPVEDYDGTFIKVVFQKLAVATATGAQAGENIYRVPLGIQSTDAIIQQLTTEHVAKLVGKKVLKDGSIVDNPKATYRISDKTRTDIAQSIKTSLNLGEDIQTATTRLQKTIANPVRSKVIAQTESVNAYQAGLQQFGVQSGAVGKEWQDVGAVDVCRDYANLGPVKFDYDYNGSGLQQPTAHVRCLVGGTIVNSASVRKTSKRFYEGRVVTLRTARGNELTVTPNHPIMTAQGWITAGELHEGMDLLSCLNGERVTSAINPDNYNVPTKIEQIIKSFERNLGVVSVAVPTTAEDFHGDGIDGEIAVINTYGLLRNRIGVKSILEPFSKQQLSRTCMGLLKFASFGRSESRFKTIWSAALRLISSLYPQHALFGSATGNVEPVSFSFGAKAHSSFEESHSNAASVDAKGFRKSINRLATFVSANKAVYVNTDTARILTGQVASFTDWDSSLDKDSFGADEFGTKLSAKLLNSFPGNVSLDKLVSIEWSWFSGHVYNLETETGWYIGNNIITHNCRCGLRLIYQAEWDKLHS